MFAEKECHGSSKLYEHLSRRVAEDSELLRLAARSRPGQPAPNLLLGAVHFLLLQGTKEPLADFYPTLSKMPRAAEEAFPSFREFCSRRESELVPLLETKRVQTNEVLRCAYLYPSFCRIYRMAGKPLALIEIGTSAGLQLAWDRYRYVYPGGNAYGSKRSDLELASEIRGGKAPFLLEESPPVSTRIGLDLKVVDLEDAEESLWLKALIWPEQADRLKRFEQAAARRKEVPMRLMEGDGISMLAEAARSVEPKSALCIFHTHVANQIPPEGIQRLIDEVRAIGRTRDVYHLYNNIRDPDLHLEAFINGRWQHETLARTDGHGRWFEWLV
ncbi:DUF2332 domain-containing protein [Paenibacillus pasadenensis]|uniref:DUF2332 domain-containing protein n=1 Tax=Paenibacillus pasadenensis TaxID=217090 RepID=UPI0006947641|nr:DUF2332 domain-containing protein [Paenibacillus pasadenensis]